MKLINGVRLEPHEVANPEAVTATEAKVFDGMKAKIAILLEDLKKQKHTQMPSPEQIYGLMQVMKMNDRNAEIYNKITNIIRDKEGRDELLDVLEKFKITEHDLTRLHISMAISLFNSQTEVFKITFLIILKKEMGISNKATLGQLVGILNKMSNLSENVTRELDTGLRNSFSHSNYWFDSDGSGGYIVYCDDTSFKNPKKLTIYDLIYNKAKHQNVLFQALIRVLVEKIDSDFFLN